LIERMCRGTGALGQESTEQGWWQGTALGQ